MAEIAAKLVGIGPVRQADDAYGRRDGAFRHPCKHEGRHGAGYDGDAATSILVTFQGGEFGTGDCSVGAGIALLRTIYDGVQDGSGGGIHQRDGTGGGGERIAIDKALIRFSRGKEPLNCFPERLDGVTAFMGVSGGGGEADARARAGDIDTGGMGAFQRSLQLDDALLARLLRLSESADIALDALDDGFYACGFNPVSGVEGQFGTRFQIGGFIQQQLYVAGCGGLGKAGLGGRSAELLAFGLRRVRLFPLRRRLFAGWRP